MIDFCMIIGSAPPGYQSYDLSRYCAHPPERVVSFRASGVGHISVSAYWWESHPYSQSSDQVRVDDNGFALLVGYPVDTRFKPIRKVNEFNPDLADSYDGDFFYLSVDNHGKVRFCKSAVCSYPIYYAHGKEYDVIGSRASIAAVAVHDTSNPELNINFARWICTYGGAGNRDAMFEGTRNLQWNETVSIENSRLVVGAPDFRFLIDQDLDELFKRSAKRYWDEVYRLSVGISIDVGVFEQTNRISIVWRQG